MRKLVRIGHSYYFAVPKEIVNAIFSGVDEIVITLLEMNDHVVLKLEPNVREPNESDRKHLEDYRGDRENT